MIVVSIAWTQGYAMTNGDICCRVQSWREERLPARLSYSGSGQERGNDCESRHDSGNTLEWQLVQQRDV